MWRCHSILFAGFLALFVLPAVAQMPAPPAEAEIQQRFAAQLPPIWKLDQLILEPAVNYGNAVEPVWKRRYTGNLSLKSDTFIEASVEGPTTFVRPVAKSGEKKVAFGTLTSEFKVGRWAVDFAHDANPTTGIGQPKELFAGQVVVLGSSEEVAYWKQREAEAEQGHKAEVARRQRLAELEEVDRKAEITRTAAEATVQAERLKAELEKQRVEREAATARGEAERRAREEQQRRAEQLEAEAIKRTRARERSFDDGLKTLIAASLPSPWKLQELAPGETHITGIDDAATFEFRFRAILAADADTFAKVGEEHAAVVIAPVVSAAERRTLTGNVQIRKKQGAWAYDPIAFDNITAIRAAGSPRDSFGGRVVVRGTAEEAELRRLAEAEALARHASELAKRQREEEFREQDRRAEAAKLAHEAELKSATAKQVETDAAAEVASRERRIGALQESVASKDKKKASAAIYAALGESDAQIRGLALRMAIGLSKTLSLKVVKIESGGPGSPSVVLGIDKYDPDSGDLTANTTCYDKRPLMGAVRGDTINLANEFCRISLTLTEGRKLSGKYTSPHGYAAEVSADPM